MAEFEFEPGETETLRHAPGWVDLCIVAVILLIEFAILAAASQEMAAVPMRCEPRTLAAIIVITLFAGACLQFAVLVMPPLVEITDRRILRRRRLGWDDPETLPLGAIEQIRQQGRRLIIIGGGTTLAFFCPPAFAPRIRAAISGAKKVA
ncbi:MAG: hypothetical protein OEN55_03930 [Alphaproteobacteria bacterium]|nr:hypothetical protein [Alphaproteobacteria bacterium]